MKYRFTEETKEVSGKTLHRIQAVKDIPRYGVKAGNLGGFVESERNLNQLGDCWVSDNVWVYGNAKICGNARVYGDAWVSGNAWVYGNAKICGDAIVLDNAWIYGNARIYGNAVVYSNICVSGGDWTTSPYQIQGSRHFVSMCTKELLKIGCYKKPVSWWIENYRGIGEREGYTEEQIQEYYRYILEAQELYK